MMKKISCIVLLLSMGVGSLFATITPAKGVFSVSATKKVQFANANCVYSENQLIQWAHVPDLIDAGWDVLTGDEWTHLLITRGTDKNNLGTVAGDSGLIILPDVWELPDGLSFANTPIDYKTNQYTAEQWAMMADAGAVFLPCAGMGWNDKGEYKVENPKDHGAYWAKNEYPDNTDHAYCMRFNVTNIHDLNHAVKTNYYSVILVRDVSVYLDETHEAAAFTSDLAAATGKYYAYVNRTLKKDSTFYTLCLPFDVPDIEASPLAGAEVFTFAGGSVAGTTGNEILHLNLNRLSGSRLTQGVPYLLRWDKTDPVETLATPLYFENVENWDDDTNAAADPGNATVKLHGVYPKAHIPGYTSGSEAHYNFFLGANNTLYWPDDATYGVDAKMNGFRAYFYIVNGVSSAPIRTGMQAVWRIGNELTTPTDLDTPQPSSSARKYLRNGQLVIIIDGRTFNALGAELK